VEASLRRELSTLDVEINAKSKALLELEQSLREANDRAVSASGGHRSVMDDIALRFVKQVAQYVLHDDKNELLEAWAVEAETKFSAKEGQLLLATEAMQREHLTFASELKDQFEMILTLTLILTLR